MGWKMKEYKKKYQKAIQFIVDEKLTKEFDEWLKEKYAQNIQNIYNDCVEFIEHRKLTNKHGGK